MIESKVENVFSCHTMNYDVRINISEINTFNTNRNRNNRDITTTFVFVNIEIIITINIDECIISVFRTLEFRISN